MKENESFVQRKCFWTERIDMQYITEIHSYHSEERSAVTLGKFDGLHRGHQKLIDKIREYASREENTRSVVCAFDMGKDSLLTGAERKARLSGQVDTLVACPFTKELREMEAEDFIRQVLAETFHASHIVVGTDFHFGHEKRGDVKMLAEYADTYGYNLEVIEKERYEGRIISSTSVRKALSGGNTELANILLGYPYQVSGRVEHGKQLGRTLGFPTMNIAPAQGKILPRFGVYLCRVQVDGRWYQGIVNIGVKPTVADEPKVLAETFAFDFAGDVYGMEALVEFAAFVRPEKKFCSVEELKSRVDADICFGRKYFGRKSNGH